MKHKNIYRISISLLLAFVMALPTIAQNTKTFKGVVLDETEQPIIGAAIKVVGTTVGTITDLDGNFTLNVPDSKEVEISYIGYVPQRFSAPFKLTKIILKEDTQQLDEVVVVGYGTQKKAHLTGAIATVPVDDIQDISSGSLASTLSGLANGISVNGEHLDLPCLLIEAGDDYGVASHPLVIGHIPGVDTYEGYVPVISQL